MRPARSSTATCFCTAAKLISYRAARADTDGVAVSDRTRMSRRVPSARARKSWLSPSSLSLGRTTLWLSALRRSTAFARGLRWTAVMWPQRRDSVSLRAVDHPRHPKLIGKHAESNRPERWCDWHDDGTVFDQR